MEGGEGVEIPDAGNASRLGPQEKPMKKVETCSRKIDLFGRGAEWRMDNAGELLWKKAEKGNPWECDEAVEPELSSAGTSSGI